MTAFLMSAPPQAPDRASAGGAFPAPDWPAADRGRQRRKAKWEWLRKNLEALEFGDTWYESARVFDGADVPKLSSRYSRLNPPRIIRSHKTSRGWLFVRVDHE